MRTHTQAHTSVFHVQTRVGIHGRRRQTGATGQECSGACVGVMEMIFRVLCTFVAIGIIICASLAISAISQVEDSLNSVGRGYENADSYRGAAGWLIFVASATILGNIVMIIVRILDMASVIEKNRRIYGVTNAIVFALSGLAMLSGGIPNAIYASENGDLHTDLCFFGNEDLEFCSDLERVVATEAASAGLSLFIGMQHIIPFCAFVSIALQYCSERNTYPVQPHFVTSHQPTHPTNTSQLPAPEPSHSSEKPSEDVSPPAPYYPPENVPSHMLAGAPVQPPMNASQYVPPPQPSYPPANLPSQFVSPSAPYYPPANVPSHMSPSAPVQPPANAPSYTSAEPPSYESVVTSQYESSSGDPRDESKAGIVS